MKDIIDAFKETRLDLTKLVLIPLGGEGSSGYISEISPKEFLAYAKEELELGTTQGLINSLANAKRAIDCQIDELFHLYGIELDAENNNQQKFVNSFTYHQDTPYRLKIIQALGLAPAYLISKARLLRNKLEHYYKKPKLESVKEAVDVADLFMRSSDMRYRLLESRFNITDEKNIGDKCLFTTGLEVQFDSKNKLFSVIVKVDEKPDQEFNISATEVAFYALLRLMNAIDDEFESQNSMRCLLTLIGHPIPSEKAMLRIK